MLASVAERSEAKCRGAWIASTTRRANNPKIAREKETSYRLPTPHRSFRIASHRIASTGPIKAQSISDDARSRSSCLDVSGASMSRSRLEHATNKDDITMPHMPPRPMLFVYSSRHPCPAVTECEGGCYCNLGTYLVTSLVSADGPVAGRWQAGG